MFAPFPKKKLGHSLPKMAAAVREPRGHSARARLWGQRWLAVPYKQGCQVLVTLPLAVGDNAVPCATLPVQ